MMAAKKKAETKPAEGPTCTVEGCDNPIHVRGLCEKHWTAGEQSTE